MKNTFFYRAFVFLDLFLCGGIHAIAGDIEVDGVYYDYGSDFAWVTGCTDVATEINIPEIITLEDDGYTVTLPVSYIGKGAFKYKTNIKSAVINSKKINEDAFYGCTGLETLVIGNESNAVITIEAHAFCYCIALKSISFGNSVRWLRKGAFLGCTALENLSLGEGIKTIGSDAFSFCVSLTSVDIPSTVETIGDCAFSADSSLVHVGFQEGLKNIGEMAFALCYSLSSIDIPKSVENIGISAFGACYNVASINVAPGNYYYDSRENCNAIIEKASKTLIAGCINTVIPNTVVNIAKNAFNRVGFESIIVPNSVENIGEYAYYKCNKANNIKIGSSVKTIGINAFRDCSNLHDLILPPSVEEIGMGAFMGCLYETVTSLNPNPPTCHRDHWNDDIMFDGIVFAHAWLYVPEGSKSLYSDSSTSWTENGLLRHWYHFNEIKEIKEIDLSADVNDDGEVNIADINAVIDMILSGNPRENGDVNCDGEVNIADINVIIDCILKG